MASRVERLPNAVWERDVEDGRLRQLYEQADFTVLPSLEEGFGLPIAESIWHGRPCIAHKTGPMAEMAQGGGCVLWTSRRERSGEGNRRTGGKTRTPRQAESGGDIQKAEDLGPLREGSDFAAGLGSGNRSEAGSSRVTDEKEPISRATDLRPRPRLYGFA